MAKGPEDVAGLEFDWLAVDGKGHVAFFSTAGGGYAPRRFLADPDAHERAIAQLLALPRRTEASCEPSLCTRLVDTWQLIGERGVFAFDSDPAGGPYRRIAVPGTPVYVKELPRDVAHAALKIRYAQLDFASATEISERALQDG